MGYIGTKPADAALTSADIADGVVTAPKLATDAVETAKVKDLNVTVAKLPAAVDISTKTVTLPATVAGLGTGIDAATQLANKVPAVNLGTGTASSSTYLAGDQTYKTIAEYDDSALQSNIAMLGFKVAVNGSLTRYNLVDQSVDEFFDASGVDAAASVNDTRTASGSNYYYSGAGGHSGITNTYNVSGSDPRTDTLQSLTLHADTTEISVEAWGGRGGASTPSWKKASDGTIDNTQTAATGTEGGGFTARLKGTFDGFDGSETIKVAVGKAADYHAGGGHGCNSGGGGGSWILLDHGGGSTIGQTRGVANSTQYSPLVVSGGGGGAGVRNGYAYNQSSSAWTHNAQADANTATSDGATRTGTTGLSDIGSYITGTDDGEGGTSMPAANTNGGGGAGFLNNGDVSTAASDYGAAGAQGKSPIDGTTPFQGGDGVGDGGYGNCRGGYGGGGGGNLSGAGGGGGFSGGSSAGAWSSDGCNGIGGGSLFGSTTADAGGYNNTITVVEDTNTVADDADYSPTTNGADGRVIVTQTSAVTVLDLTLQSTDVTAESSPSYGEFVTLIENAYGTATLNTDIKGYISRDSGVTFTQGTLVDEGTWGTNKQILAFHDLALGGSALTDMCYKITTHNQVASSKETRIYATSIGWR